MNIFNRLTAILLTAVLVGPVVPLEARTKKGDKFLGAGRAHEEKRQWDEALEAYEKALSEDPGEIVYQMAAEKARFQAAQNHVNEGIKIRAKGQLGEALIEFQKAYAMNPASSVAAQEVARTQEMILRERKRVAETGKETPPEQRGLTPAEEQKRQTKERIERILPVPELKPLNPTPLKLTINNQTAKVLFDTIGKVAGLNVLWDPEYQAPSRNSFNVDFDNTTVEQALDYIGVITKSYWKALSPNTIFITNDNTNKRRDYEEMIAQTFYLSNVSSPQEIQEIVNTVRSIAEVQRVVAFQSQNAIIVRGEADRVALASKLIHDLDKPRAEVVVDILVMEASTVFKRQITAALAPTGLNLSIVPTPRSGLSVVQNATTVPTTGSTGTSTGGTGTIPTNTTGGGTETTGGTGTGTGTGTGGGSGTSTTSGSLIPLSNLHYLNGSDFAVNLPSATLQAVLSDTKTKVLQAPQLRMVDNVKAELKIGERQPTATGSFQPGIGGVGINPLVNTQFNFIDVGVNVSMLSHVHDNGDVSMHIDLDISTVSGHVNLGGIDQPIIGQRKVSHDIRMHEGEINLLGGLINSQESKQITGIPGLSSIPLLRRLFTGESIDNQRGELMIVLVPHIVRAPDMSAGNLRGIAVGNQQTIKLSYAPKAGDVVSGPAAAAALGNPAAPAASALPPVNPASPGPVTAPAVNPPAGVPGVPGAPPGVPVGSANPGAPPATAPPLTTPATPTSPPAVAPTVTGPPMTTPSAAPPATAPPAADQPANQPPGSARILFSPAQMETRMGAPINVAVVMDNASDVASAPLTVRFDPRALKLLDVLRGEFFGSDGQQPVFTKNILNDAGIATIQLNRQPGTPGVSGGGVLVTLQFQAIGRGNTVVNLQNLTIRNSQGLPIAVAAPQFTVTVQ